MMILTSGILLCLLVTPIRANWHEWWTYDGISGPSYWGVINPAWTMCNRGRHQSPINIVPANLLYEKRFNDVPLHVDKHPISGQLINTGQSLIFKVDPDRSANIPVNITGGPLSYRFQFEQMILHWGNEGDSGGSEHSINGQFFPAELQLYGYNDHLFSNLSEAVMHPNGAVAVAIMIQESERGANSALRHIVPHLRKVKYRSQSQSVHGLLIQDLLPSTSQYITYEGSATYPGCWETVTWIVLNKPIYISSKDLFGLRQLMQGDQDNPKAPLGLNSRPIQPLNCRTVRTNIAFPSGKAALQSQGLLSQYFTPQGNTQEEAAHKCPEAFKDMYYQANIIAKSPGP